MMTTERERRDAAAAEVRDWARRRGFEVGTRGHLPTPVIDAFNRRHKIVRFENKNPLQGGRRPEAE